ncbi:heat shock factor protein isoform X1 [Drosophila novamexicana]|uniref:heat shock factor protein isoform X1 n=2 Tax=Drosophila novamexicana TaxID=47314 RepID=UPI0011E5F146|nr:heat shock factor protein isoform X1 [Drosophila novamexicana]
MSKTRASFKSVQLKHESTEEEEDDEDQQQQRPRRNMHTVGETGSGSGVPAFLAKLWRLVDDPDTNNLICWSKDGRSFIIQNQAQFARELLPLNYKHNNMASFIRQLNMYGFHKITSIENGGLRFDRDEIEFSHPCFKRNYPYLLDHIKRKISNTKTVDEKTALKQETVSKVLSDVKAMRGRQDNLDSRFSVMKQENEALWREIASLRQKHAKQQQIVNKLIQFLISIVQPSRNMSGVKRHMQLMINDTPENARKRNASESESEGGPVIHELSEELLDEVMNPNSPYAKQYDAESVSPLAMERPRSNTSITSSQNYDYSNQSAEDFINAQLLNSGDAATNVACSPGGQQVLYTVTEAPDSHVQEQNLQLSPNSLYNSDEQLNVLTTPMVREQEARKRQQLKEKNKQRRDTEIIGQVDLDMSPKASRARSQSKEQPQVNVMPQPVLVKTEPELSSVAGGSMPTLLEQAESNDGDLYNVNFISNDMPTNIFEDDSLMSSAGMDEQAAKLDQQQQFGSTTVNTGKFANAPISFDLANSNNENPLVTDANLASTSKAAAGVQDINDEQQQQKQQQQQQQQQQQPMTVAKYTGDNGPDSRLSGVDEVTGHLDNMQDELDTLKDLLRGEGVSIDQNMLMGAAPKGVAARMPVLQLTDEELLQKVSALFNDSDVLDNYGLSFLNDSMGGDKKASSGSELMAYQPSMYDLSDILDTDDNNKPGQDSANGRQMQAQSSVLNTPRHDM